jgi:hypothetical protein
MTQVTQTILTQLGGNKFVTMTGASNLLGSENSLSFKVGRNAAKVTHVRVTLTAMDDYQIEFLAIRGVNVKPVAFKDGLTCEQLAPAFASKTGMALSL